MSDWSHESLWQKAKLYAQRAIDEDREGPLFPLWATLALEFTARAALAKVHPSLLADPRDGENVLHACGFEVKNPRSVPAKTVFSRCRRVCPEFTEADQKMAMFLTELRNQELHTGTPAFAGLSTGAWLASYYRLCRKLLSVQGKTLEELFGKEEGTVAIEMIKAIEEQTLTKVKQAIATCQKQFQSLPEADQKRLLEEGSKKATEKWGSSRFSQTRACPSCGGKAVIDGEKVKEGRHRLEHDEVAQEIAILPTSFECFACGLSLQRHAELHAADLGGHYTVTEYFDPVEYFNIDVKELASEYVDEHFDKMMEDLAADAAYSNE